MKRRHHDRGKGSYVLEGTQIKPPPVRLHHGGHARARSSARSRLDADHAYVFLLHRPRLRSHPATILELERIK
ncbi:MAG: hypothetical protein IPJ34_22420 [Myxococcales bacterium]|nr:hypothetical protein [Myxococcales bacterium]